MKSNDLQTMSLDELWDLHELVVSELTRKIMAERATLENRLRRLSSIGNGALKRERRLYPEVQPKYRNPKNPVETWAGRGKQPRWLTAQLLSGKKLNDFLIRGKSR